MAATGCGGKLVAGGRAGFPRLLIEGRLLGNGADFAANLDAWVGAVLLELRPS